MPVLATTPAKARRTILVVGDSLSAEYGLRRGSGWVAMLAGRLDGRFEVVNASISGETTAGGRSRLPGLLERHRPAFVVIALGGNDALRGLDLAATRGNLDAMLSATRAAGAVPVLAGIQVPPNYGKRYTSEFASIVPDLARAHDAALVPFILAGVAERLMKTNPRLAPDKATWLAQHRKYGCLLGRSRQRRRGVRHVERRR